MKITNKEQMLQCISDIELMTFLFIEQLLEYEALKINKASYIDTAKKIKSLSTKLVKLSGDSQLTTDL